MFFFPHIGIAEFITEIETSRFFKLIDGNNRQSLEELEINKNTLSNASSVKEFFQNVSTVLFKPYDTTTRTLC